MNAIQVSKRQQQYNKMIASEEKRIENMATANLTMMEQVVKILPDELTSLPNYNNYYLKYGVYQYTMKLGPCEELQAALLTGFAAGRKKYPDEEHKFHNALIIKGGVYPGYEGYGIHQGTENESTSKKFQ